MATRKRTIKYGTLIACLVVILVIVLCVSAAGNNKSSDVHRMTQFDKTPESQRAKRDELVALLDAKDPNSIFKVIDAIQADAFLSKNCHEIAHDVGHEAYELYGFSEAMTFNNPNHVKHALPQYICAGGYMHGILEELSLHEPDFLKKPEIICDQVALADRPSCFHGVGHVFMMNFEQNVPESILGCRVIRLKNDMYRCFEGVRMEQFWGNIEYTSTSTLGWDTKNPFATCIAAQTDEKPTCFLYSTFGYLRFHPKEYKAAAQQCIQMGMDESDSHFCLKGLGMTMMSKFKGKGMESSEVYVEGLTIQQKHAFYQGVVNYSMLNGLTSDDLQKACGLLKNDSLVCEDALSLN